MIAMIVPGSMGGVCHAIDLFGIDRVDPGHWGTGVKVRGLTREEFDFAVEFFAEFNLKVVEIKEPLAALAPKTVPEPQIHPQAPFPPLRGFVPPPSKNCPEKCGHIDVAHSGYGCGVSGCGCKWNGVKP